MIRRTSLLVALLAVVTGCAYDGPPIAVEAVSSQRSVAQGEVIVVTLPDSNRAVADGVDDASTATGRGESGSEPDVMTSVDAGDPLPTTVAVVGDSLTLSAENEIEEALTARGLDVLSIDAVESRRMTRGGSALPPGVDAIEKILATERPGLWVIALGTNDVASVERLDDFRDDVRAVLSLIPADDPVIWVDLWIRGREESIEEANRVIRSELRRWSGGAVVVDWYGHGLQSGVITGDGVHLTESGQQLFADSIVEAVDGLYRR